MFYYVYDEFIIARRFHVPGIYDAVKIAEIVTLITCVSFLRRTEIHWYFWNEETSTDDVHLSVISWKGEKKGKEVDISSILSCIAFPCFLFALLSSMKWKKFKAMAGKKARMHGKNILREEMHLKLHY